MNTRFTFRDQIDAVVDIGRHAGLTSKEMADELRRIAVNLHEMGDTHPKEKTTEGPDTWLSRDQAAAALTAAGFPISPKTLASMATRGGGPPYQKFGPRVIYRLGDTLEWALSRLT